MLPLEHSYPCADRSSKDTHGNNCQAGKKHGGTETNWAPCLQLAHSVLAQQHLKGCARHLPASRAHTTLTKVMTIADNMAGFKSHHFPMAALATGWVRGAAAAMGPRIELQGGFALAAQLEQGWVSLLTLLLTAGRVQPERSTRKVELCRGKHRHAMYPGAVCDQHAAGISETFPT